MEFPLPPFSCFDSLFAQKGKYRLYQQLHKVQGLEPFASKLTSAIVSLSFNENEPYGRDATGFIISKGENGAFFCLTAAHAFGNPRYKELILNCWVSNNKNQFIAKGILIAHPWISNDEEDMLDDQMCGRDPVTLFDFMMPNDAALFRFETQCETLAFLEFKQMPASSSNFYILGFPQKFIDDEQVKFHTPNYSYAQSPKMPSFIPAQELVAQRASVLPCSKKNMMIAFKASTAPGMSGGPLIFIDQGNLYACGIYNGPAAVPGHRLFAYLLMSQAYGSSYVLNEIKRVKIFLQSFAHQSDFEMQLMYPYCYSLQQSRNFLIHQLSRMILSNFDPTKNNHNLAIGLTPFVRKVIEAQLNPKLFRPPTAVKINQGLVDRKFSRLWKKNFQTAALKFPLWYNKPIEETQKFQQQIKNIFHSFPLLEEEKSDIAFIYQSYSLEKNIQSDDSDKENASPSKSPSPKKTPQSQILCEISKNQQDQI